MLDYPIEITRSAPVFLYSVSELMIPIYAREFQWSPSQVTALLDNAVLDNPRNLGDVVTGGYFRGGVIQILYGTDLMVACALVYRYLIDEGAADAHFSHVYFPDHPLMATYLDAPGNIGTPADAAGRRVQEAWEAIQDWFDAYLYGAPDRHARLMMFVNAWDQQQVTLHSLSHSTNYFEAFQALHMPCTDEYDPFAGIRGRFDASPFEKFRLTLMALIDDLDPRFEVQQRIINQWPAPMLPYGSRDDSGAFSTDQAMLRYSAFLLQVQLSEAHTSKTIVLTPVESAPDSANAISIEDAAALLFGADNPNRRENLERFLFGFDTWLDNPPSSWLSRALIGRPVSTLGHRMPTMRIQVKGTDYDLVRACTNYAWDAKGSAEFSLKDRLLLASILEYRRLYGTTLEPSLHRRLRQVRNLFARQQIFRKDTGDYLETAYSILRDGLQADGADENVQHELFKQGLAEAMPSWEPQICTLENHILLNGRLDVVGLDPEEFMARSSAFLSIFESQEWLPIAARALLANSNYVERSLELAEEFPVEVPFGLSMVSEALQNWKNVLHSDDPFVYDMDFWAKPAMIKTLINAISDNVWQQGIQATQFDYIRQCEKVDRFDLKYYMSQYPVFVNNVEAWIFPDSFGLGVQARIDGYDGLIDLCLMAVTRYVQHELQERGSELRNSTFSLSNNKLTLPTYGCRIQFLHHPWGFEVSFDGDEDVAGALRAQMADLGHADGRLEILQSLDSAGPLGKAVDAEDRVEKAVDLALQLTTGEGLNLEH